MKLSWVWITQPQTRWLFARYSQDLSIRDSVKTRRLIQSKWFQDRWGDKFKFSGDQNAKTRFENDKLGFRLATSVDGILNGTIADVDKLMSTYAVMTNNTEPISALGKTFPGFFTSPEV